MKKVIGLTEEKKILIADISASAGQMGLWRIAEVFFTLAEIKKADDTIRNKKFVRELSERYVKDSSDSDIIALCNKFDCPPYKLVDKIVVFMSDKSDEDILGFLNLSEKPKIIDIDGVDYVFMTNWFIGVNINYYNIIDTVNKNLFDDLIYFKDNYQSKNIAGNIEAFELYQTLYAYMEKLDDNESIKELVRRNDL